MAEEGAVGVDGHGAPEELVDGVAPVEGQRRVDFPIREPVRVCVSGVGGVSAGQHGPLDRTTLTPLGGPMARSAGRQ